MTASPCHIYVPASFDPERMLPAELHRYADAARYLLHRIIWGDIRKQRTLTDFVPLKFDYLRTVIPDRVIKPLKTALIEESVIECDGFYVEGEKAYGYRLGPAYRSDRIARRTIGGKTAEKVRANRRDEFKKIRLPVHKWLRSQYRHLDVDLPRAMSALKNDPNIEINKIPVEQLAFHESEFSCCRMGRIHSSLSRCPKVVRPALHVSGTSLVGLDIANSQPLFLALVVINYRTHGKAVFRNLSFADDKRSPYHDIDHLVQETVASIDQYNKYNTTPATSPSITNRKAIRDNAQLPVITPLTPHGHVLASKAVNNACLKEDEHHFVQLCEQGRLYETLQEQTDVPVRKWVKEELFTVLFGENRIQSPFKAAFRELFPHVAEVVRELKRKDYRLLSCMMQNMEAHFMIYTVCRRIMLELPDAPVFTIHDSFLTTRQFVESIRSIMVEEFARLGLSPTLHEDDYEIDHEKLSEAL